MRRTLRLGAASVCVVLASISTIGTTSFAAQPTPTLRRLAQKRHLKVGTAMGTSQFGTDPEYLAAAGREYSSVTPENAMKWDAIHPERDRYNFIGADQIVAFAQINHMMVRGHTLVWHSQNPAWLTNGTFTRDELIQILHDHIATVVGHYRGRVKQWDVVNEVIADDGSALRDNLWLRGIGPDYIAMAFRFAHQADPDARLYLNDYLIETANPKSDLALALAALLRASGVPIDGIGVQMHRFTILPEPAADVEANLGQISDAGFQVWITEMDVAVVMPADAAKLADQAVIYGDVVRACLRTRRCRGITTWGFTDRYSWIPSFLPGFGAALPFDQSLQPKPAYQAIVAALA